jgi:nucleoid-associated protein Lsr2
VAQKVVIIDDLDGSEAAQTVKFSLRDTVYEIDLSEQHAQDLDKVLAPYIQVGRVLEAPRGRRGRKAQVDGDGPVTPADIRAWAEAQGMEVPKRGRIPADVTAKFMEAQH